MNKIGLIIRREYLSRVRKRSFLIMSIIGPLLFAMMMIVPMWLASREGDEKVVEILDESGLFPEKFESAGAIKFKYTDKSLAEAKRDLKSSGFSGLLYIPKFDLENPEGITFIAENNPGIDVESSIRWFLKGKIEDLKIKKLGLDKDKINEIKADVDLNLINNSEDKEKEGDVGIATATGYFAALLIYFFIFLYGIQTLRGVIEEKSNRIVEVIISSVKPIQLMIGKIIGIGAVGLTQFALWIVLTFGIYQFILSHYHIDPSQMQEMTSGAHAEMASGQVADIIQKIDTINFPLIIGCFIFFFITAYLFYGALFAAVGSAVDNDADAQQFQLPVTLPLILSIILLAGILRDPHGNLAFWTSVIPFTAPVVMMMRLPFDPPAWHIVLSMVSMVIGFIFTTWLASRIYRIGILMHGAKVNYKTLAKWLFMKN